MRHIPRTALLLILPTALLACTETPVTPATDGSVPDARPADAGPRRDGEVLPDGGTPFDTDLGLGLDGSAPIVPDESFCVGATYYVSPTGNDSNDGSMASPWATLAHATNVAALPPGATIHLAAGTHNVTEQCHLPVGVCLEGEGPESIIISTLTADWTAILDAVSPQGTDGHQHISNLKFDGQDLSTFWGINVAGRSNFSIYDTTVVDFKDRGVIMTGRDDNLAEAPTSWATGCSFHDNIILNSAAYDTPNGVYGRGCLNVGGTEGMLIYNNTITQNQRPVGYNGWPIKAANDGWNRGLKIYNNLLTKIPFTGAYGGDGGWDFAVEMFWDQGTEFYGNVVSGGAFDTNWQSRGTYPYSLWIHDNVFSLPTQLASTNSAVILELDTDSVIIENNTIDKMSNPFSFTPRPGNTYSNITIAGNLCTNVGLTTGDGSNASFINVHSGTENFTLRGFNVYNNTFLADPGNRPWFGIELGGPTAGGLSDIHIVNNIIAHTLAAGVIGGSGGGVVIDGLDVSNNDVFDIRDGNDPMWVGPAPTRYTYADNIHVDPMFVSASDYHLQPGSPCIDAGKEVGRPHTGSAPDIGYAER